MKWTTLLLAITAFFTFACSDAALEGSAGSQAAETQKLEDALNDSDFSYIINKLEKGNGDYSHLNARERYLLQMAYIGTGGFNTLDVLSEYFEDDKKSSQILMSSIQGAQAMNSFVIATKRTAFGKAVELGQNTTDKDHLTAAGVAAAMDTLLCLAEITQAAGEVSASFDSNDIDYIGTILAGKSDSELEDLITPILNDFTRNNEVLTTAIDSITVAIGEDGSIKEKLESYQKELMDANGELTAGSIVQFIRNEL